MAGVRRSLAFYELNEWRDRDGHQRAYLRGLLADFEDEQHARAEHEREVG